MSDVDVDALSQRIAECGSEIVLDKFLSALGMVVVQVLQQYPKLDERMAATVSWIAILSEHMRQDYKRSKAN